MTLAKAVSELTTRTRQLTYVKHDIYSKCRYNVELQTNEEKARCILC